MASRVLHLVSHLERFGEGSPLVRLLPHLADAALEHRVLAIGGSTTQFAPLTAAGIECRSLGARWNADPLAWARLRQRLRHDPPAIVHVWDTTALTWFLSAAPARTKFRALVSLARTTPLASRVAKGSARRLDRWIASSHTAHTAALAAGLPADRGTIVPRGSLDPATPAEDRSVVLPRWGVPPDSLLVATASRLDHQARLKELIWAADMVRVLHPKLRYVIVGDGPARRGLEYFARTAAIPENILFAGDRDPRDLLPHCRVYWEGSEGGDTTGLVLDAMACGVPVVASDIPLHREWIDPGKQGYLVGLTARADRTRATDLLISDNSLHHRVSEAAQQRALSEHPLAREAAGHLGLYRQLAR